VALRLLGAAASRCSFVVVGVSALRVACALARTVGGVRACVPVRSGRGQRSAARGYQWAPAAASASLASAP
jgi:hypothetical protein